MPDRIRVLIDLPVYPDALQRLQSIPEVSVDRVETPEERTRPLPAALIRDANVLLCTFPPENFHEMRALKLTQIASAGYSQLFGLGLAEQGIRVCNGRGNFDIPIAEWNIAMMIALARNLRQMIRNQDAAIWDRSAIFQNEIRGSAVGIWGYGGIGRETARLAKPSGLTVHVMSRWPIGPRTDVYTVPGTG